MLFDVVNGQTGLCLRVKVRQDNTGARPGQGYTGLTSATSGLIISTICDNEATPTTYTSGGSTIDAIATLGTYSAPATNHCAIKKVDDTNHPGLIEIQLDNARYAVTNAKELTITICGVSGMADCDVKIPLRVVNPYSTTFGITGNLPADLQTIKTQSVACAGTVTFPGSATLASTTNITAGTMTTTTNLTNAPTAGDFTSTMKTSITTAATAATPAVSLGTNAPAGWINAAAIGSAALNGKGDWNTTTPPTASANAIATWDLARSGHTTSGTFGEAANAIVASDAYTSGTAQAGTSTTITLASDAPSFTIPSGNGGFLIVLISGTGLGQQATITAYNTSSKVATIGGTWKTTPDSTTVYRIYYLTATTADHVLDELVADHTITGSAGKALGYLTGDAYVRLGSPVTIDLSQTGLTPRDLGSVADASLTVGDALVAAISGATGKETVVSTTYTVKTPYTGTVIRTFTLDSATSPASRT